MLVLPLAFIVLWPNLASRADIFLRVITSLGAALVGATVPGVLKVRLPGVQAVGAVGLFLVVFLWNPPEALQPTPAPFLNATGEIVVGAKDFLESSILAELMAQAIESRAGEAVVRKHNLGESPSVYNALRNGKISIYPEYTGTILAQHLNLPSEIVRDKERHAVVRINQELQKNRRFRDLRFIGDFGINNPWVIVMLRSRAIELGLGDAEGSVAIERLAEILRAKELSIGATATFYHRMDGYWGLASEYGLSFKEANRRRVRHDQKVDLLADGSIDIAMFYGTDPELHENKDAYVVVEEQYFPDYWTGALTRNDVIERWPAIEDAMNHIRGLSAKDMAGLIRDAEGARLTVNELGRSSVARSKLSEIVRRFVRMRRLLDQGA